MNEYDEYIRSAATRRLADRQIGRTPDRQACRWAVRIRRNCAPVAAIDAQMNASVVPRYGPYRHRGVFLFTIGGISCQNGKWQICN